MKVLHTPGPWMAADGPSSVVGWPVVAQQGRAVASVSWSPKPTDFDDEAYAAFTLERKANAQLIACAPDLLRMLKHAVDVIEVSPLIWLGMENAKALIAKAGGRS